ncbi:MAG TPA: VOC family protein [Burkholderiales bacterium]|nr:VOC family protein [Burkholderiales bacterium]
MVATKLIPSLGVSDIQRSIGFYRTYFGFKPADSYEQDGRLAWCWLRCRGADLMLQQLSAEQQITLNPAIGQSWVIYIRPDDLYAAHHALKQGGFPVTEIRSTSYGTREFLVTDPDGYELWVSVPSSETNGDDEDEEEEQDHEHEDEDEDDEEDDEEEEWKV